MLVWNVRDWKIDSILRVPSKTQFPFLAIGHPCVLVEICLGLFFIFFFFPTVVEVHTGTKMGEGGPDRKLVASVALVLERALK